jgi:hypothetical protein
MEITRRDPHCFANDPLDQSSQAGHRDLARDDDCRLQVRL